MINHLMSILISIFLSGYHGKTTDFAKNSLSLKLFIQKQPAPENLFSVLLTIR